MYCLTESLSGVNALQGHTHVPPLRHPLRLSPLLVTAQIVWKDVAAATGNHPPAHRSSGAPVCVHNCQREFFFFFLNKSCLSLCLCFCSPVVLCLLWTFFHTLLTRLYVLDMQVWTSSDTSTADLWINCTTSSLGQRCGPASTGGQTPASHSVCHKDPLNHLFAMYLKDNGSYKPFLELLW